MISYSIRFLTLAVFAMVALHGTAQAQTETINATLITSGTLQTTKVSDFDFGEFFILIDGVETPTLTMEDNGGVAVTVGGVTNSTVAELTAPTTRGAMTVTVPADNMALTLTRDSSNNFADAGLSLTALEYGTATEGNGNAINADLATGTVTAVNGGVAESILFGAVVTAGPQPANATHTADVQITLSF